MAISRGDALPDFAPHVLVKVKDDSRDRLEAKIKAWAHEKSSNSRGLAVYADDAIAYLRGKLK